MKKKINLLKTTNAMVWAKEFVRLKELHSWTLEDIDEGLMVGWFANAMAAQESRDLRKRSLKVAHTLAEEWDKKYGNIVARHLIRDDKFVPMNRPCDWCGSRVNVGWIHKECLQQERTFWLDIIY